MYPTEICQSVQVDWLLGQ